MQSIEIQVHPSPRHRHPANNRRATMASAQYKRSVRFIEKFTYSKILIADRLAVARRELREK